MISAYNKALTLIHHENSQCNFSEGKILGLVFYTNSFGDVTNNFYKPSSLAAAASHRLQMLPALEACTKLKKRIEIKSLHSEEPSHITSLQSYDACLIGKLSANNDKLIESLIVANLAAIIKLKLAGTPIALIYSDNYLREDRPIGEFYRCIFKLANYIIYPSKFLMEEGNKFTSSELIKSFLIHDPWQIQNKLLPRQKLINEPWKIIWFGSNKNLIYLIIMLEKLSKSKRINFEAEITILASKWSFNFLEEKKFLGLIPKSWTYRLVEWSAARQPQQLEDELTKAHICLIPSDPNDSAKAGVSHNRLVDSVRAGCLTIASPMESYKELKRICLLGQNFEELILAACNDYDRLSQKHAKLSVNILEKFSPDSNNDAWEKVIKKIITS